MHNLPLEFLTLYCCYQNCCQRAKAGAMTENPVLSGRAVVVPLFPMQAPPMQLFVAYTIVYIVYSMQQNAGATLVVLTNVGPC